MRCKGFWMKYVSSLMIPSPEKEKLANEGNSSFFFKHLVCAPSANLHSGRLFWCVETVILKAEGSVWVATRQLHLAGSNYTERLVLALWIRWLSFSCYWRVVEAVVWSDLFEKMPRCSKVISAGIINYRLCFFVPQIRNKTKHSSLCIQVSAWVLLLTVCLTVFLWNWWQTEMC